MADIAGYRAVTNVVTILVMKAILDRIEKTLKMGGTCIFPFNNTLYWLSCLYIQTINYSYCRKSKQNWN